jgi:hypothetical protein
MLAAAASELQPLDERAAHAWMQGEVTFALLPGCVEAGVQAPEPPPGTAAAEALADARAARPHRRGAWRGRGWWHRVLPAVLACVEPDELLGALGAALPVAGACLAWQRAAAGLVGALLQRSTKAARNTIERVRGRSHGLGNSAAAGSHCTLRGAAALLPHASLRERRRPSRACPLLPAPPDLRLHRRGAHG